MATNRDGEPANPHKPSSPSLDRRALIIDDDPDIRRLVQVALRSICVVEAAENGSEALARVSRPPPIHLIICDVMMPQLSGFDFVQRLQLLPGATRPPIIFLTASQNPSNVITGIQLGARHYLTKPFRVDDLVKKVQKLLRG